MDWIGLLIFVPFIIVFVALLMTASKLYVENKNNKVLLEKALIEKAYVIEQLSAALQEMENNKLEKDDSFVKFLSTSRDWAYGYIEKVQEALLKFDKDLSKSFAWHEKFGKVNGTSPATDALDKVIESYKSLKELMPEQPPEHK
jgi:hypothetical protein